MATFTNKKKDSPKRWRGQVTMMGRVVASKWFGSSKADEKLAIAWEVQKKKELAEAAKQNPQPTPLACERQKLSMQEWANAYLEESKRRNTIATFKAKRDGFKRLIRYLEKSKDLSPDAAVSVLDRRQARLYLAWQNDQRGPNCSNKDRKILTTAWKWGANYLAHFPITVMDAKNTENRVVHMPEQVQQALKSWHTQSKGKMGFLIFPKQYTQNTPLSEIGSHFKVIVRDCGLNEGITDRRHHIVFHSLRHTFASWLVQAGVPLYTVQKLMGHKTITMTQRYAHLAPDQGAEAARVLSNVVLG